MDPVNGLSQLVQILRQKVTEHSPALSQQKVSHSGTANTPLRTGTKASIEETKRKIGERIKALSDEDARSTKGAQIFVEVVMTWEFGNQLLQDAQFTELSKDIVTTMSGNSTVWTQLQTLLSELRQG